MTLFRWSRTAATNATADTTCPFPEGMSASALNDSARGQMAAVAKYRDDVAGPIVTGGSVNAYTVTTYQGFDTLAHLDGMVIAFTPHITSTGAVQVNVDSLGLKPYRPSPGVDFIGGELIQGTPYVGVYNNSNGEIYARGFMSSPYAVPVFGGMDFWDTIAPNSSFIFPAGQAISRSVYSRAFARWGTTFGAGDGSTTFNVPDKTERVSVMKAAAASRLTSTYFGGNSTVIGATGGGESSTLLTGNLPAYTPSGSISMTGAQQAGQLASPNISVGGGVVNHNWVTADGGGLGSPITTATFAGNAQGGTSTPVRTVQPTIVCNYILRII